MTPLTLAALRSAFYALDATRVRALATELRTGDSTAMLVCATLEWTPEALDAHAQRVATEEAARLAAARRRAAA